MLLRQLFEEINKTAVLGWGRGMGHKGHMLLAKAVLHHAQEMDAKAYFVVSRTSLVDPATGQPWADRPTFTKTKDDPLSPEEKLATYRKVFPQNADVFSVASADATKLEQVLAKIAKDGYRNVTLVVGEDQKNSMGYLTNPDKSGVPPFKQAGLDHLTIISRQDTTEPSSVKGSPDYQEGPRATPMRAVLTDPTKSEEEQFAVWRDAMPDNLSDEEVKDLMFKAKQRMSAVPDAKNKKKDKMAVAEGTSIESTLRAVINDIGEPITAVYDTMKFQAKKYMENHGELGRGFRMVAAGVGGRWVQSMYVGRLQNELYDLCRYNSRRTVELKQFLRGVETDGEIEIKRSFGNIANELPRILAKLGQYLNAPQLTKNANRWMQNKAAYEEYIANLELEDDYDEPVVKPEKSKMPGQQNAQAEQIVNDILSKLPKNVAGDIRNAIARAPNKLQALHQELSKRKIQGVAEGKVKLYTDPNWYGATVDNYQATGPVVNISADRLVGFEPDSKMNQPKSKANVKKIVAGLKKGDKLPPLLVRKYKDGYQVLDGHHRFWAYKLLDTKSIPAQIVPAKDIEEISKQGVAEASLGNILPWPEVVNKVSSAMKATGWKGKRMSDDAFMFTTRGAEVEDQWYIAIIDNAGEGFFRYALGTVEEGDPHIDDAYRGKLPNTEASVSELINEIREGFGLA